MVYLPHVINSELSTLSLASGRLLRFPFTALLHSLGHRLILITGLLRQRLDHLQLLLPLSLQRGHRFPLLPVPHIDPYNCLLLEELSPLLLTSHEQLDLLVGHLPELPDVVLPVGQHPLALGLVRLGFQCTRDVA